jgi:RNA polymerase sigma-70 factor (ECF subfamily)
VAEIASGLLAYAVAMSGDPQLGEEAAQDALTALVIHWQRQGPPDSPRAFTYTVARRALRRSLWKRRLLGPIERVFDEHHAHPDPEEVVCWRSELSRAIDGLGRLSHRDREALLLTVAGELSTADAARVLGISRSAFKMRVHRARQRLASYLEKNDEFRQRAQTGGSAAGLR